MAVIDLWLRDQRLELYHARTFRLELSTVDSGAKTFLELTDTPSSYSGNALKLARVNAAEDAIEFVVAGTGSGDVTGPSSSTDNALARFDSTTGKIIQNGTITEDDTGILKNVSEVWFGSNADYSIKKNGTSLEIWVQGVMVQKWG